MFNIYLFRLMVKLKKFLSSLFSWWVWAHIKSNLVAFCQIDIGSALVYLLKFLLRSFKFIFQLKFIFIAFVCSLCVFWIFWITDYKIIYLRFWDYVAFFGYVFLLFLLFTDNFSKINGNVVVFFIWFHIFTSIMDYFFIRHVMTSSVILVEVTLTYLLYPLEFLVTSIINCANQVVSFWIASFKFHTSYVTIFYRPRLLAFIKFVINCWFYIKFVIIPFIKSTTFLILKLILPFNLDNFINFLTDPEKLHKIILWFLDFLGKLLFNMVMIIYLLVSFILSILEVVLSLLPLISAIFYYVVDFFDFVVEYVRIIKIYYHPYEYEIYKLYGEALKIHEKSNSEDKSESKNENE